MSEQQPEETFRPARPGAKQRRADSLREMHDQYAMVLWRYVVSLTNRPADADDIVQETLLRAWRKPDLLEDDVGSMRG
ncbi:sigma factor [Enteractinococcus helveticum]|uniref:sigma factor n=1 Tax=Enteractinococcus helveticum TaxID=1837282 RepID=UPI002E0D86CC